MMYIYIFAFLQISIFSTYACIYIGVYIYMYVCMYI